MNNTITMVSCLLTLSYDGGLPATQADTANKTSAQFELNYAAVIHDWKNCLDGDNSGSDYYVMDCHYDAKERLLVIVDELVAARRSGLSAKKRRDFDREQARWLKHEVKKCSNDPEYRFNGGGTKYPGTAAFVVYGFCIVPAIQKRIATLTRNTG